MLLDDAFRDVPAVQRLDLLDQLGRASVDTQVIVLSDDEVVTRWARDRSSRDNVTLYEAGPEPAPAPVVATSDDGVHLGVEPTPAGDPSFF